MTARLLGSVSTLIAERISGKFQEIEDDHATTDSIVLRSGRKTTAPTTVLSQGIPSLDEQVFFKPVSSNFAHLTIMSDSIASQEFDFLAQVSAVSRCCQQIGDIPVVLIGPQHGPPLACKLSCLNYDELSRNISFWESSETTFRVLRPMCLSQAFTMLFLLNGEQIATFGAGARTQDSLQFMTVSIVQWPVPNGL